MKRELLLHAEEFHLKVDPPSAYHRYYNHQTVGQPAMSASQGDRHTIWLVYKDSYILEVMAKDS
jgi:hypothetical protein